MLWFILQMTSRTKAFEKKERKKVRSLLCLSHTGDYNWKIPHNLILDCTTDVLQMSASAPFIVLQLFVNSVSNVCCFTDRYISYWLAFIVSFWNVTPAHILQSSSREYKQKLVSISLWTEWCFSMEILTSQSRRGQSRCPAVWPPHAAQKDLSCWGADRAWTTRLWAGHRADILRSSPEKKKRQKNINWT